MLRPTTAKTSDLTKEERRARRLLRREKQRKDNIGRAAKMHAARVKWGTRRWGASRRTFESIGLCRMLWLVLLEVAGIILSRRPANR
jgi:hypothetical protein